MSDLFCFLLMITSMSKKMAKTIYEPKSEIYRFADEGNESLR